MSDALLEARAALRAGAWEQARRAFTEALAGGETGEAWEGLSWAAWWLDDADACLEARERAYRLHRDADDLCGAARMALWLSDDHVVFRGDTAVAGGWRARAGRLLADLPPGPEHAWLAGFRADVALSDGHTAEARRLSIEAQRLGREHGVGDLEVMGLAMEGVALVDQGEVEQGLARLDEAATAALAGECEELPGVAYTCCLVVSACDRARDVDRAAQWCRRVEEYGRRVGVRFVHGSCRAYYASVLVWQGHWDAAERELEAAVGELAGSRPAWRRTAVVRLGELRRRQGRADEAERLFAEAEFDPLARLGLAEIHLDRGESDTARALLERMPELAGNALADAPARPLDRLRPLELMARVEAAAGDIAAGTERLRQLREVTRALPVDWPRAVGGFAEGMVAAAAGDTAAAQRHLGEAVERFAASGAPFETARARLELARVLEALGRAGPASHEATAAARRFAELGAAGEHARALRLLERLDRHHAAPATGSQPLTARQLEVLHLIADGLTDREIAARLVVSEHTVHRHIANVLTRLGCSSRSAAVAAAARLGLLSSPRPAAP